MWLRQYKAWVQPYRGQSAITPFNPASQAAFLLGCSVHSACGKAAVYALGLTPTWSTSARLFPTQDLLRLMPCSAIFATSLLRLSFGLSLIICTASASWPSRSLMVLPLSVT